VYTPLDSRLQLGAKSCDLSMNRELVGNAILNARHLVSYSVLFVLAALVFRRRALVKAGAFVLLVSMAVEIEQAYFTSGHCRLRDLIPNTLAIAIASASFHAVVALRRFRKSRAPFPHRTS
jgi:VanZ family protein